MNTKKALSIFAAVVFFCVFNANGQINLLSNDITFRTPDNADQFTGLFDGKDVCRIPLPAGRMLGDPFGRLGHRLVRRDPGDHAVDLRIIHQVSDRRCIVHAEPPQGESVGRYGCTHAVTPS